MQWRHVLTHDQIGNLLLSHLLVSCGEVGRFLIYLTHLQLTMLCLLALKPQDVNSSPTEFIFANDMSRIFVALCLSVSRPLC